MSGPGDAPPPEVPEEFADAYRAAYEQAMAQPGHPAGSPTGAPSPSPRRSGGLLVGTHRAAGEPHRAALNGWRERVREERWIQPVGLAVLIVVLLLAAYFIGRAVRGSDQSPQARVVHGDSTSATAGQPAKSTGQAWSGAVSPIAVTGATASCTSPPAVDAAGHRVTYPASNTIDHDPTTAWRCNSGPHGLTLHFRLPANTTVAEVGLIAGYAKTDPVSHTDRYAQNDRITEVRWRIGSLTVDQTLDGSASHRAMQLLRIPPTAASQVTLEILAGVRGPFNTTAISGVTLAAPA